MGETGLRVAVIGFGSIGQRHARLIAEMGHRAVVVSRRVAVADAVPDVATLLASGPIDACVIANETAAHLDTLAALRDGGFAGPVLVEKPVSASTAQARKPDRQANAPTFVAYNLRFHPLLARLRAEVGGRRVLSARIRVGQDLRTWRDGRDGAQSYSGHAAAGGGVLRDLSHELDYFTWLFGEWRRVAALGGRVGTVTVDSDDCWAVLIETDRCPIGVIQLDYHSRWPTRTVVVQLADETIEVDLVAHRYRSSAGDETIEMGRDRTYQAQLDAFLSGAAGTLCSLDEGLETVRLIEAIEQAGRDGRWVGR